MACMTDPPEVETEEWIGVATRLATASPDDMTLDTLNTDTTWIRVIHERVNPGVDHATLTIWETEPDPCDLSWLPDEAEPCSYMTKGTGFAVPASYPATRVIDFELPVLGECELAGWIHWDPYPPIWNANLRCGEERHLYYTVIFQEHPDIFQGHSE